MIQKVQSAQCPSMSDVRDMHGVRLIGTPPCLADDDVITDGSTVALRGNELSIVSFFDRLLAFWYFEFSRNKESKGWACLGLNHIRRLATLLRWTTDTLSLSAQKTGASRYWYKEHGTALHSFKTDFLWLHLITDKLMTDSVISPIDDETRRSLEIKSFVLAIRGCYTAKNIYCYRI